MSRDLRPVASPADVPAEWRGTPVAALLEYHGMGVEFRSYERAELLIGMCMDNRKTLRLPENFAYVLRAGGANFQRHEFKVSFAIAIGGVRAFALIGHSDCGMVNLAGRRPAFVQGMVERAGWSAAEAEAHFDRYAPTFEIGDPVAFTRSEAQRLRGRYPKVLVAPLLYDVADGRLYAIREG